MSEAKVQFQVVMFIDIPTAAHIREAEGGSAERSFLDRCVSILSVVRKQHDGVLVRTVGSTLLCTFATADNAIQASASMNEAIARDFSDSLVPPSLRIGMQAGDVTIRGGGCSGDVVTTAARIVTLAQPHQILTTEVVHAQVTPRFQHRLSSLENAKAMESRLNVKLFEVMWEKPLTSATPEDKSRTSVIAKQPPPEPAPEPQAPKPQLDRIPLGHAEEEPQAPPQLRPPTKEEPQEARTTDGLEFTDSPQELTPPGGAPVLRGAPLVDFGGGTGPSFLAPDKPKQPSASAPADEKPPGGWIVSALEEDGGPPLVPAPTEEEGTGEGDVGEPYLNLEATTSLRTSPQGSEQDGTAPDAVAPRPRKKRIILKEIVERPSPSPAQPEPTPPQSQPAPASPQLQAPTAQAPAAQAPQDPRLLRLCLIIHQKVILVDAGRPNVSMGRDESNDVIIGVHTASRRHAEVALRDGAFYLIDHSWNGTYVYDEVGYETLVHNSEVQITRSGVICPGCPGDVDGVEAIRFVLAS
ncbi:MAG: FHA domain-containing protein [Lentisphaerae bacterium]|jgi:class 3 adenylate cyclase|nr:FHA domain-containing protein [Lentisphaerota bacterium]MBT4821383.1 FHA domain-containing protein [Lentisphaerota bacterium]MBT5610337.1 FHA domain-containing protein [Lentisphaerota bacterium]MBT7056165.1 FHA domain-containing protein [Lentisphaerota bacterium]MBT7841913.1 FHA domain-containing protein [Lentisphaerota bacterium]